MANFERCTWKLLRKVKLWHLKLSRELLKYLKTCAQPIKFTKLVSDGEEAPRVKEEGKGERRRVTDRGRINVTYRDQL